MNVNTLPTNPKPNQPTSAAARPSRRAALVSGVLLAFAFICVHSCSSVVHASLVTFIRTNSVGQPDTNSFKVVAVSQIYANGTFTTVGVPQRITPGTDGRSTNYFAANNYYATNYPSGPSFTLLFQVPDNSSNVITAGDYQISGGNYFVTRTVVPTGVLTNGSAAYLSGLVLKSYDQFTGIQITNGDGTANKIYGNGSDLNLVSGSGNLLLGSMLSVTTSGANTTIGPSIPGSTLTYLGTGIISNSAPTIVTATANTNGFAELLIVNKSAGGSASSDLTLQSDNGTATSYYLNLGINSSGFTNAAYAPIGTNTAYIIAQGNASNTNGGTTVNLYLGAAQTNSAINFSVGNGLTLTNASLSSNGFTLNNGQFTGNGAGLTNVLTTNQTATIANAATNSFTSATPALISPLITPGGLYVLGDSLTVGFVTNLVGYGSIATNGGLHSGGVTNLNGTGVGWFTNGYSLIYAEAATWTNQSWAIQMTNLFKTQTGWTVPLDTTLAVSGAGIGNFGNCDVNDCFFEGNQSIANGAATYPANGSNTFLCNQAMTNKFVFWGTNDYGTTNDIAFAFQGGVYTNPIPGQTWSTNIYCTGSVGGYTTAIFFGQPNQLRSFRRYNGFVGVDVGSQGAIGRQYYPPLYSNSGGNYPANDPMNYLSNNSPMLTGYPKRVLIYGSQNDRNYFMYNRKGTNNSPNTGGIYTNGYIAYGRQVTNIAVQLRSWGYSVYGANIPNSPNTSAEIKLLSNAFTNSWVLGSLDAFYDWRGSNSLYEANSSYFTDNVHPTAQLANIWATNHATAYDLKRTAIIK